MLFWRNFFAAASQMLATRWRHAKLDSGGTPYPPERTRRDKGSQRTMRSVLVTARGKKGCALLEIPPTDRRIRDRIATGLAPLPEPEPGRTHFTIYELARLAGTDKSNLYREVKAGRLRAERRGGRIAVSVTEARRFIRGEALT
jgi:hypothetical protein